LVVSYRTMCMNGSLPSSKAAGTVSISYFSMVEMLI
jgi:hypothetical protein